MPRPWHRYVLQQEAGEGGSGGGASGDAGGAGGQNGGDTGAQGGQGGQGGQGSQGGDAGLDGNALFKKGNAHAEKVHNEWLQRTFGTTDRSEIEKALAAVKKPKGEEIPGSVVEKMNEMARTIDALTNQISERDRNQALTEGILSSGLDFNNRQDVIDLMRLRYDFKTIDGKMVAHSKQNGEPVILGNKFAEVKDILTAWSKDPQHAYLFSKAQRTGMPDAGRGNAGSSRLKAGELTNPEFVQALKDSGEYYKAMTDQPFDREKVEHFLKLQGGGKNLTAVQVG